MDSQNCVVGSAARAATPPSAGSPANRRPQSTNIFRKRSAANLSHWRTRRASGESAKAQTIAQDTEMSTQTSARQPVAPRNEAPRSAPANCSQKNTSAQGTGRKTTARNFAAADGPESPPSKKTATAFPQSAQSTGDTMSTASCSTPKSIADTEAGQCPTARKIWQH